jgi:hypothetical protein
LRQNDRLLLSVYKEKNGFAAPNVKKFKDTKPQSQWKKKRGPSPEEPETDGKPGPNAFGQNYQKNKHGKSIH